MLWRCLITLSNRSCQNLLRKSSETLSKCRFSLQHVQRWKNDTELLVIKFCQGSSKDSSDLLIASCYNDQDCYSILQLSTIPLLLIVIVKDKIFLVQEKSRQLKNRDTCWCLLLLSVRQIYFSVILKSGAGGPVQFCVYIWVQLLVPVLLGNHSHPTCQLLSIKPGTGQ